MGDWDRLGNAAWSQPDSALSTIKSRGSLARFAFTACMSEDQASQRRTKKRAGDISVGHTRS